MDALTKYNMRNKHHVALLHLVYEAASMKSISTSPPAASSPPICISASIASRSSGVSIAAIARLHRTSSVRELCPSARKTRKSQNS